MRRSRPARPAAPPGRPVASAARREPARAAEVVGVDYRFRAPTARPEDRGARRS